MTEGFAFGQVSDASIETERLRLEPLGPAHADELFETLASPAVYTFIAQDPPSDLAALRARYERLSRRRSPDGSELWLNWAVRVRASGRCAGRVEATLRSDRTAAIAYLFAPEAQGAGFATESCRAMIDHLVAAHGASCVEATIDTRNRRSILLALRLGLTWVKTTESADTILGARSEEALYRLVPTGHR